MNAADGQIQQRNDQHFGIMAGWGQYPIVLARALRQQGHKVFTLLVKDHADPAIKELSDDWTEIGLGQIGKGIRFLRRHQVTTATMVGKIHKVTLFEPFIIWRHKPDWTGFWTFYRHFLTRSIDNKDDSLLMSIVNTLGANGITMVPATDYIPEILVEYGQLCGRRLTQAQRQDIEFGWKLAKEMGRLDVGQSVAVKNQAVLAIEAVEGTDACIRRAGELCRSGGFTVVKVAKPQQDMRFDVPTIGLGTLETLVAAGGTTLAVEADKTIVLDRDEIRNYANKHKLTIVAVHDGQVPDES